MKTRRTLMTAAAVLALTAAFGLVLSDAVVAKGKPGGGGGKCPRTGIFCLDVWDPVICDDGQIYSNACYAYVACATGCESTGGGPFPVE